MRAAIAVLTIAVSGLQAQPTPDVETLVSRLGTYLREYEQQLSAVIAQERYRQSEVRPLTGRDSIQSGIGRINVRTLESEIAFLRLPGDREWYGVRSVLRVNGKPAASGPRLLDAMKASDLDRAALIKEIVRVSSLHNLGASRTINMHTVPLELLACETARDLRSDQRGPPPSPAHRPASCGLRSSARHHWFSTAQAEVCWRQDPHG